MEFSLVTTNEVHSRNNYSKYTFSTKHTRPVALQGFSVVSGPIIGNHYRKYLKLKITWIVCATSALERQECIPVGCVPSAVAAISRGVLPAGVYFPRGCAAGGCLRGGGIPACTEADTPSVNRMTDRCKNITFAASLRTVKTRSSPFREKCAASAPPSYPPHQPYLDHFPKMRFMQTLVWKIVICRAPLGLSNIPGVKLVFLAKVKRVTGELALVDQSVGKNFGSNSAAFWQRIERFPSAHRHQLTFKCSNWWTFKNMKKLLKMLWSGQWNYLSVCCLL